MRKVLHSGISFLSLTCFLFVSPQTVEKWTLRDIQAQFGGGSRGNSGGGVSNHSGGAQNMLHPPPIPARRNATSSAPPPQTSSTSQAGVTPTATSRIEDVTLKSQSAPSSPTEKTAQELDAAARGGLQNVSPNRPRSMAVPEESIKYTTIKFADVNHHPPPARRNTAYSDIKHPSNQPSTINESESSGLASPLGDERPISPSYVSMGVCHVQLPSRDAESADQTEEPAYDVPPPPVPVRFGGQDGSNPQEAPHSPPTPMARDASKKSPDDPFTRDPFYDSSWNDPSAFYDTPRSVLNAKPEAQEDCYIEIGGVTTTAAATTAAASTTADFTGDSSYEDTSSFLLDIRARFKNSLPGEMLHVTQAHHGPSEQQEVDDTAAAMYDLPPIEKDKVSATAPAKPSSTVNADTQFGSYDFPAALSRFPFREGGEGGGAGEDTGKEKSRDEPPLHTIQYPTQRMPFQHSVSESVSVTTAVCSTTGVVRSESVSHGSRANIPLPPTPLEQNLRGLESSGRVEPPPLPARQGGALPLKPVPLRDVPVAMPTAMPPLKPVPLRDVPGAAVHHKPAPARDGALPPIPNANDRPPLPPMNLSWRNKKQAAGSSAQDNPPLPPRNKAGGSSANGHPDGSANATPQHEDPTMLDLMSKGYQRADIESALRIAKNDHELAKSILKEFGGRH